VNRLISTNLRDVRPDSLPPMRRDGPARVLFLNCNILGLRTVATHLKRYCETHDGIDAVHIDFAAPLWMKILGKQVPRWTAGWDFHRWRYIRMWAPIVRRWLRGPLSLDRFDVVQVTTQNWVRGVLGEFPRDDVRLVIKIDATAVQDIADYGFSARAFVPIVAAERKMYPFADLVVADTRWACRSVRDDFGISEGRIHRATNGVLIPSFSRQNEEFQRRDGLVRIAFVGNTWRRKGGDLLLSAHQSRLCDRAELHVIGKIKPADRSARNVTWHGPVPREKLLNEMLPRMDIFTLPSLIDMLPFSSVEAAATGLPIVVPRLAGYPELVHDGETGLLFERGNAKSLGDALERLVDDPKLRDHLGRAVRQLVRREFDADRVYPEWLDRLVALVDDPTRAHDVSAWTPSC
jgi:glycosyltransferase involved in cell wall biosynthesis